MENSKKNYPPLRILSHEELQKIYETALRVLSEVGMQIEHPKVLDILSDAGACVDKSKNRVFFPSDLVDSNRKLIPKEFTYHGRTPEFDYTAALDGPIGARPAGGCIGYNDLETGNYRRATLNDWREIVHLADALPNIRGVGNLHCGDVPMQTSDIHSVKVVLESGRKCAMHGAATADTFRYQVEMLLAVRGSRKALTERSQIHHNITVTNPLFLTHDHLEQLLIAVENGVPIDVPVMSMAGISSPITVVGTLVQNLAEELGTITIIQSVKQGHPVAFFIDPVVGNMRTADAMTGAPEVALTIAAACQLGTELFGLPTEAIGFDTDGYSRSQNMFQKAQNLIFQAMAGGKFVVGAGCIESILTLDPVQLIIDDELITIAERLTREIIVDEYTLAFEAIKRVGPRGSYLGDEHTIKGLRAGEIIDLNLSERECKRKIWENTGKKTIVSRAREKGLELVRNHIVPPLPDDVLKELDKIVKHADETIVK